MEEKIIIEGGSSLQGTIQISGAKNTALKLIAAALLTKEPVILKNVPRLSDIELMVKAIEILGARIEWLDEHILKIQAEKITSYKIPEEIVSQMRASFVILGPLLARFRKAIIANPGGCKIGARPVNRHIEGFENLGAKVLFVEGYYHINGSQMKAGEFTFSKNTHTGTENLILGSVLTSGTTLIKNAAEEPEIDDLIDFLNKMGAKIKREGNRQIAIEGVNELFGTEHTVMPDRNEAATFAIAAAVTGGKIFLQGAQAKDLVAFLNKIEKVGVAYQSNPNGIHVWRKNGENLNPIEIETHPHSGFMTDWHPPFTVLLTQVNGVSTIHETVMDKRFGYVRQLQKMGAKIEFYNPHHFDPQEYNFNLEDEEKGSFHAIKIFGPAPLFGTKLEMLDLRAGATVALAALAARGISEISGVAHIRRGYEKFVERLQGIGANIKMVEKG